MAKVWAVAVAQLHQQEKVVEQFIAKGFDYFFPLVKRTVRRKGRRLRLLEPLLFNYVPVQLEDFRAVLDMRGVDDVLAPASELEILKLKIRCDSSGVLFEPEPSRLQCGERVRPTIEPFRDMIGSYVGLVEEGEREEALFNILGAARSIKFELGDLVAA